MVETFKDAHYQHMIRWYWAHNIPAPSLEDLPSYGLIKKDLAAGFLIMTDCKIGYLEFYIGNPNADETERHEALDQITEGLLDYGRKIGLKYFKADTQRVTIARRAERHGFKLVGSFSSYFMKG